MLFFKVKDKTSLVDQSQVVYVITSEQCKKEYVDKTK